MKDYDNCEHSSETDDEKGSLHLSQVHVAHHDGAYPSMEKLGVFLFPLDGIHCRVTPNIMLADTHLYTWVERGTMRVKCLAH